MSESNGTDPQERQLKVCPIMSTPDDQQTCIGEECQFWRRHVLQFADGDRIFEDCAIVIQAQISFQLSGPIYTIAGKFQEMTDTRIHAPGHPSFRS